MITHINILFTKMSYWFDYTRITHAVNIAISLQSLSIAVRCKFMVTKPGEAKIMHFHWYVVQFFEILYVVFNDEISLWYLATEAQINFRLNYSLLSSFYNTSMTFMAIHVLLWHQVTIGYTPNRHRLVITITIINILLWPTNNETYQLWLETVCLLKPFQLTITECIRHNPEAEKIHDRQAEIRQTYISHQ